MNSKNNGPDLLFIFGIEIVSFRLSLRMTWLEPSKQWAIFSSFNAMQAYKNHQNIVYLVLSNEICLLSYS